MNFERGQQVTVVMGSRPISIETVVAVGAREARLRDGTRWSLKTGNRVGGGVYNTRMIRAVAPGDLEIVAEDASRMRLIESLARVRWEVRTIAELATAAAAVGIS